MPTTFTAEGSPFTQPRRRATYADIEALPDHLRGEILDGLLFMSPRPAMRHVHVGSLLGGLLTTKYTLGMPRPGGWWIEHEPELHLDDSGAQVVIVPDLAGWRCETMHDLVVTPAVSIVPDWVCEILSPGTAASDRAVKLPLYGRLGVKHLWIVDPIERSLEVYENESGWRVAGTFAAARDATVCAAPFTETELPFSQLFVA